jgi:hypothetical protein
VRTEPAVPDVPGPWNIRPEPGPPDPADGDERLHALEREEHQRLVETCALLHRATLLAHGSDSPVPHALQDLIATMVDDPAAALTPLRRLAEHAVGDPNLLDVLLSVMRGDFEGATELPAPVQELAQRGLVATRTIPVFRVWPVDVPARDPE